MSWNILLADPYVSPQFDELHAKIDNYQIYSVLMIERLEERQVTKHQPAAQLPPARINDDRTFRREYKLSSVVPTHTGSTTTLQIEYYKKLVTLPNSYPGLQTIELRDEPTNPFTLPIEEARILAAANGFSLYGVLPSEVINFTENQPFYAYEPVFTDLYGFYTNLGNHPSKITIEPLTIDEYKTESAIVYQSFSPSGKIPVDLSQLLEPYADRLFRGQLRSDCQSLIKGHFKDSRLLPKNISVIASSTRNIKYGYYRSNWMESHPKISNTLDWVTKTISVIKGKPYFLPIVDPVLGTMVTDSKTQAEVMQVTQNNRYSCKYLFKDFLPELIAEWDIYYPPPDPISLPLASSWTRDGVTPDPPLIYAVVEILAIVPTIRVMAANNDRWGYGTGTISRNRPAANHSIFIFDWEKLFTEPQIDGSYGTYMTDSPRTIETLEKTTEIHEALEAGTYASYLDADGQKVTRVTNLGWKINKLAEVMGIRRKPNGKFLSLAEQAKYDRTRLSNPKWAAGEYEQTSWGNKGYALRHFPTAYVNGQRQDNQYDLVTSFPQMLEALIDQIDLGQGLQHTSEIRIKVGDQVQSYANLGQLTIDLATRVIELEALMQKSVVMQIETSNTVRELWPAIGLAVTTKSVIVKIGGKAQQIFYPGYQAGKSSIRDIISAGHVNLGILMGQLMPQKVKSSRLNPFRKK